MSNTQAAKKRSNKILSLQVLRGLAASLVVYTHAIHQSEYFKTGESLQESFFFLRNIGAVGVDIFFIISGFIITVTAVKYVKPYGAKDFLIKRLIRVLPIFWLLTIVEAGVRLSSIKESDIEWRMIVKSVILLPIFDNKDFTFPIIGVGWSLSFEMYFYTLIAAFLLLKRKNFIVYPSLFITGSIIAGLFALNADFQFVKFITNPIMFEFIFGCVIAKVCRLPVKVPKKLALALIVLGISGLLATLVLGCDGIDKAEYILNGDAALTRVAIWGIPSALLVFGSIALESSYLKEYQNPVAFTCLLIGDASYSIYLTHVFSLRCLRKIWEFAHLKMPDAFIIVATLMAIAVGVLFYIFCEKKIVEYLSGKYVEHCTKRDRKQLLV